MTRGISPERHGYCRLQACSCFHSACLNVLKRELATLAIALCASGALYTVTVSNELHDKSPG